MPAGFENGPDLLAYGGELKAAFCVLKDGAAILSQHQGDLEDLATFEDYQKNLRLYARCTIIGRTPRRRSASGLPVHEARQATRGRRRFAAAGNPASSRPHRKLPGREWRGGECAARAGSRPGWARRGADGTLWGGEFCWPTIEDFSGSPPSSRWRCRAAQAIREPWRTLYAHLTAALGAHFMEEFSSLELCRYLRAKPLTIIDRMLERGVNAPLASSCGRLFDAVAAALGLCRLGPIRGSGRHGTRSRGWAVAAIGRRVRINGPSLTIRASVTKPKCQRGILSLHYYRDERTALPRTGGDVASMPLADVDRQTAIGRIAARFHLGLAAAVRNIVTAVRGSGFAFDTVCSAAAVSRTSSCWKR